MELQITKAWLKPHQPCNDGYQWFLKQFPQGGTFAQVYEALRADRRYSDSDWLVNKAFIGLPTVDCVGLTVEMVGANKERITTQVAKDLATTGNYANSATTGNYANSATTGEGANSATTGYRANSATTGEGANSATTGEGANSATTGNYANSATTGEGANSATTGEKTVSASVGRGGSASAGPKGCIVLGYWDEQTERPRVKVGYVGEDGLEANVTYKLNAAFEFEAVSS